MKNFNNELNFNCFVSVQTLNVTTSKIYFGFVDSYRFSYVSELEKIIYAKFSIYI